MQSIRGLLYVRAIRLHLHASISRSCQILLAYSVSDPSVSTMSIHNSLIRNYYPMVKTSQVNAPQVKRRLPQNEEITAELITVIDESGKISGPHQTNVFLEDFDFGSKSLITVVEGNLEDGRPPLCRVVKKSYSKQHDLNFRDKKKKKKETPTKIIEMSWVVEKHDLDTKLRRLREFIEKGCNVKFILKAKKKGKLVSSDDAKNILKQILETVEEAGGREQTSPEGELLGSMEMSFARKKSN